MYCVSHYDKKQLFAHMGEMGLTLDPKDFATNEYQVNEREHPRSASRASGRKGKAVVPSEDEEEDEEQEEEDCAGAEALQGANADTSVSLSDDDEDIPSGGTSLHSLKRISFPLLQMWKRLCGGGTSSPLGHSLLRSASSMELILLPPGLSWRRDWQRELGRVVLVPWLDLPCQPLMTMYRPLGSTIWRSGWTR